MQKIGQKQTSLAKLGTKMATPQKLGAKRDEGTMMTMAQPTTKKEKIEK